MKGKILDYRTPKFQKQNNSTLLYSDILKAIVCEEEEGKKSTLS